MTVTLELSPATINRIEKEATVQNRSVEAVAANTLERFYTADESGSELDAYQPSQEEVEQLRLRVQSAKNGDTMPFNDYVEQVRQRRKTASQ